MKVFSLVFLAIFLFSQTFTSTITRWNSCKSGGCGVYLKVDDWSNGGTVNVLIQGDFGHSSEYATIRVANTNQLLLSKCQGGSECSSTYSNCGTFTVPKISNGELRLYVKGSSGVNYCGYTSSWHGRIKRAVMTVKATFTPATAATPYEIKSRNTNHCDTYLTMVQCKEVAKTSGNGWGRSKSWSGHPKACFMYGGKKFFFNSHSSGGRSSNAAPVCKASAELEVGGPDAELDVGQMYGQVDNNNKLKNYGFWLFFGSVIVLAYYIGKRNSSKKNDSEFKLLVEDEL